MNDCGGVLTPRDDFVEPVCFVKERGEHPSGRPFTDREIQMSVDHFYPRSVFGDESDMPTHFVHRYDQTVQGGMIGGPRGGQVVGLITGSRNIKFALAVLTPEQRAAGGRKGGLISGPLVGRRSAENGHLDRIRPLSPGGANLQRSPEQQAARARIGNHARWHVRAGKPCTCTSEVAA